MDRPVDLRDFCLRDLAYLCRCCPAGLFYYLSGRKALPRVEARLAVVLGIEVGALRQSLKLKKRARQHQLAPKERDSLRRWARARLRDKRLGKERSLWTQRGGRPAFHNQGAQTLACPRGREALAEARGIPGSDIRESWNGELRVYRGKTLIQRFK